MGLGLQQPEGTAAVSVPAAAAWANSVAGWRVTDCVLGFHLRACQAGVVGQAGGCHLGTSTAVGLQLALASHW